MGAIERVDSFTGATFSTFLFRTRQQSIPGGTNCCSSNLEARQNAVANHHTFTYGTRHVWMSKSLHNRILGGFVVLHHTDITMSLIIYKMNWQRLPFRLTNTFILGLQWRQDRFYFWLLWVHCILSMLQHLSRASRRSCWASLLLELLQIEMIVLGL